jgi:hypothetical protein
MSEEFDDIIRQKFAEKEFMFNEANWEKAEMKIDAARRMKKILLWGTLFSIGLITGICLMFAWGRDTHTDIANSSKTNLTEKIETNQSTTRTTSSSHLKNNSADNTAISADNEIAAHTDETTNKAEPTDAISSKNKNGNYKAEENTRLSNTSSTSGGTNKTKKVSRSNRGLTKNSTGKAVEESESLATTKTATTLKKAKQKKSNRSSYVQKSTTGDAESSSIASDMESAGTASDKTISKTSKNAKANKKKIKTTPAQKDKAIELANANKKNALTNADVAATDSTTATETQDSTLALQDKLTAADSLNDSLKVLAVKDSIEKKIADSIKNVSTAANAEAALGLDGLASINLLSLDGGINGQVGWNYFDKREGRNVTPVLGVGITHFFNQKWSFNTGLHYSMISHLENYSTNSVAGYSFGSNVQVYSFRQRKLHYIGAPLLVQYHVNEKNAIFAGGSISYLFNNKIQVDAYQVYAVTSNAVQSYTAPTTNTYTGYYNIIDASVIMGYRRKIGAHFTVAPAFYFGLADIKKDTAFGLFQFERNSGFKLVLSYTIFDF